MGTALVLVPPARAQQFAFEFGTPGSPSPAALGTGAPSVAVDVDGSPWVADPANDRVVKYDYSGAFVAEFRTAVGGGPALADVVDIAADDRGSVYAVRGTASPGIVQIDTGGAFVRTIAAGRLDAPSAIAVDDKGRFYVPNRDRLMILSPTGAPVTVIRNVRGAFSVAVFKRTVWVATSTLPGQAAITGYAPVEGSSDEYEPVKEGIGFAVPTGARPIGGLATDSSGRILVAGGGAGVTRLSPGGEPGDQIGALGSGVGESAIPNDVAIDCRQNTYVVDGGPSKVLKFEVPGAPPPPCEPRVLPQAAINTQINDVEVTQAVQPAFSHTAGPVLAPGQQAFTLPETEMRSRAYGSAVPGPGTGEVPLKAHLKTVVRVYANLTQGPVGGIANVPATLEAVTPNGRRLGPIQTLAKPPLLRVGDRTVDPAERTDPVGVYTFDLPNEWTLKGTIDLIARVNPAGTGCELECRNRSTFRLSGVPFGTIRTVPIAPVALTDGGRLPVADPRDAFAVAQRVTPLLLEVQPYRAQAEVGDLLNAPSIQVEECFLDIWPCEEDTYTADDPEFREYRQGELMERLDDAADDADIDECDLVPIGLVLSTSDPERPGTELPGAMHGEFLAQGFFPCALGYATVARPTTAVAHELQHAFGRPHAGQGCPGTGPDDDQAGEPWPPDDRGLLGGIGLDTETRAGGSRGPHETVAAGVRGRPAELFDLMSYCAGGDDEAAWISPGGWNNLYNWRVASESRSTGSVAAAARQGESRARFLRITAIEVSSGRLAITGISPTTAAETGDPASPYVLHALGKGGGVLASSPVTATELGDTTSRLITGTVPAPAGTFQLSLQSGGDRTLRVRSPRPPKVKLLAPRARTRIAGRIALVRWRANDPDGGELTARIEYSADGGTGWHGVYVGPDTGEARIPRALLRGSRRARLRVRIDDGFSEDVASSKRFSVAASAPLVRITDPVGKLRIGADARLVLRGEAYGNGSRPLRGKRLRWFDGRRRLGRGATLSVAGLEPGRHRITLAASQDGRSGRAGTTILVRAVKPAFLRLDAPASIGRKARSVRLRVASTVTATLRAGGKRFAVSPRPRALRVPLARGRQRLRLELRAGRLSTRHVLTIARG